MSVRIARGIYNPEKERIHFYVAFKPALDPTADDRGAEASYPVDGALSVTETGELADIAVKLPKPGCNTKSVMFRQTTDSDIVIDEKVYATVPGLNSAPVLITKAHRD